MKKKILIVDDDEEICEELVEMLRAEGYAADAVSDGLAGRRLIEKKPYHLIVLDLKIPTLTGIELLEFIRRKKPGLKVMVVTARSMGKKDLIQPGEAQSGAAAEQMLLKAAHAIVKKPFDIPAFLSRIRQLLKTAQ